MNAKDSTAEVKVTADHVAEAAAWVAILHGPSRTAAAERGFAQWLKASPVHPRAFEEATEIWEEARNIPRPARLRKPVLGGWLVRPWAAAAITILMVVGVLLYLRGIGVATRIGEQRMLVLDDGSRVILNTNSRVVVSYNHSRRQVDLKDGEALFEVAQRAGWPFVVVVGEQRIRALGTAFAVRREKDQTAVTLVEGKVSVTSTEEFKKAAVGQEAMASAPVEHEIVLTAGERVTFVTNQMPRLDKPQIDKVLAWERREVALDNTALVDALSEINRYNSLPVVVQVAQAGTMRVTGLFRAGDSLSFARAVAEAYGLKVSEQANRILLSGTPRSEGVGGGAKTRS